MDELKQLAKITTRLFYSERQVVIIELLTQQSSIPEQILSFQLKLNPHEVRKSIGRLLVDKFVKSESIKDPRSTVSRTFYRTTYYLDYKSLYDAVKYKIYKIQSHYTQKSKTESQERKYHCSVCKSSFSQLEATQFITSEMLFKCPFHRPGDLFHLELEQEQESESHIKLMKFNTIVEPILILLRKIEDSGLKITAETENQRKLDRQESIQIYEQQLKRGKKDLAPVVKKEVLDENQVLIEIKDFKDDGVEAEKEKERKRVQNILPSWHAASTIVKEVGPIILVQEQISDTAVDLTAENLDEETSDIMTIYKTYREKLLQQSEKASATSQKRKLEENNDDDDEFEEI